MKSRRLAVYGLTAGLLGGGAAGFLLTGSTLASAQESGVTGTVTDPAAAAPAKAKGDWAKSALDPLVANGTINQTQEDAVIAALDAARPAGGPGGKGGPGRHGFGNLSAAASALTAGEHTQAEADQMLADAKTRIEAFVNGTAPALPRRR